MDTNTEIILNKDNGLVLSHYKEPLLKVDEGFGYKGAILTTLDGEKIQCHICGKLFSALSLHIYQTHKMKVVEYREKFDLARSTALVSEAERERQKMRSVIYFASISPEEREKQKKSAREGYLKYMETKPTTNFKIRLETKNKRGTCPDQLIQKIRDVADILKHVPSKEEFIDICESQRYIHLIYTTFGSWKSAVQKAGFKVRIGIKHKGIKTKSYNDEELLEYLQFFYQENRKIPTYTDCRRGLIPDSEVYSRRWGSLPKARKAAGLPDLIPSRYKNK